MVHALETHPDQVGTCYACGFLCKEMLEKSLRDETFYEMSPADRLSGSGNAPDAELHDIHAPSCYLYAANFTDEIGAVLPYDKETPNHWWYYSEGGEHQKIAREVFWKDRKCPQWYRYIPGRSPKEHYDMILLDEMEKDRRQHREDMAALIASAQKDQTEIVKAHKEVAEAHKEVADGQRKAAENTGTVIERLEQIAIQMQASTEEMKASTKNTTMVVIGLAALQVILAGIAIAMPLITESNTERLLRQIFERLIR